MGNPSETFSSFVSTMSKEHDILMGSLYSVFFIQSLMGNCILLLVAYHRWSALKPAEFFIINLSISDFFIPTVTEVCISLRFPFSPSWSVSLFSRGTLKSPVCGVLFDLCNLTALSLACCLKGTACCTDWHAPSHELSALSYIACLFVFCYALPCTIIFLSYTFILLTVQGPRQAVQQHVSLQTKDLYVSMYECLTVSPFRDATQVPSAVFALAAAFAKSFTIYNLIVYLLCNFRECLYRNTSTTEDQQRKSIRNKDISISTHLSNGQQECLHCTENTKLGHVTTPQRTVCILTGSTCRELTVSQLSAKVQADFL
uniref:G-protein coupled receptors family 1 profile domain-containing protein n=1 Tax=Monopterus albus TaxID=43700 RepID=A0A3Q3IJ86_MONAL